MNYLVESWNTSKQIHNDHIIVMNKYFSIFWSKSIYLC